MARSIVLACMTGVTRDDEIQLGCTDWRSWRGCRLIRLHRRDLRLRCGVGAEVVRKRSPSLSEGGEHTRNHRHDVGDVCRLGNEVVSIVGESDLQWCLSLDRMVLYGLGNIFSLVENIVVTTE
jgi:hypothetical protein